MSDDAPRSTHGNRPDQRRGRDAPVWWDQLKRSDLPDDPVTTDTVVDTASWDAADSFPGTRTRRDRRLATTLIVLAAALVAIAVAAVAWVAGATTRWSTSVIVAVIVGVPATLMVAALLATVGRRRRR